MTVTPGTEDRSRTATRRADRGRPSRRTTDPLAAGISGGFLALMLAGTASLGLGLFAPGVGPLAGRWPLTSITGFVLLAASLLVTVVRAGLGRRAARSPGRSNRADSYLGTLSADDLELLLRLPTRVDWSAPAAQSLESLLREMTGIFGAQRGVLFLPGPDGDLTRVAEVISAGGSTREAARFEDALALKACRDGVGLLLPAGAHPQLLGLDLAAPLSRRASWLAVPLPNREGPGALVMTATGVRGGGFVRSHVELLDLVAGSIARCSESAARITDLSSQLEALRATHERFLTERQERLDAVRRSAAVRARGELQGHLVEKLRSIGQQLLSQENSDVDAARARLEDLAEELTASSGGRGDPGESIEAIPFDELLKNTVARQAWELKRLGIDTRLELSCPDLFTDPRRDEVEQLIRAMIQHAIARLREAPRPRVLIARTLRTARRLRLVIRDSGRPLAVPELASVLRPDPGTAAVMLQTAARIASDLHGELQVTSPPGAGLEQTLELPATQARARASEDSSQHAVK